MNKCCSIVDIKFFTKLIIMFHADGYYIPSIIPDDLSLNMTSTVSLILAIYNTANAFLPSVAVLPMANPAFATAVWIPTFLPQVLYDHSSPL
jgi:hypothetical protein